MTASGGGSCATNWIICAVSPTETALLLSKQHNLSAPALKLQSFGAGQRSQRGAVAERSELSLLLRDTRLC